VVHANVDRVDQGRVVVNEVFDPVANVAVLGVERADEVGALLQVAANEVDRVDYAVERVAYLVADRVHKEFLLAAVLLGIECALARLLLGALEGCQALRLEHLLLGDVAQHRQRPRHLARDSVGRHGHLRLLEEPHGLPIARTEHAALSTHRLVVERFEQRLGHQVLILGVHVPNPIDQCVRRHPLDANELKKPCVCVHHPALFLILF